MPKQDTENYLKRGVLTIPVLAKIINVSVPVVRRWIDDGLIKNVYSYPGSNFRKIPAPSVVQFLRTQGMVVPKELIDLSIKYNQHFAVRIQEDITTPQSSPQNSSHPFT